VVIVRVGSVSSRGPSLWWLPGCGARVSLGREKIPPEHLTLWRAVRVPRTSTVVPRVVRHTTRVLIHTASQRRHHGNPFSTPPPPSPTVDEDYHRPTAVTVAAASGGSVYEVASGWKSTYRLDSYTARPKAAPICSSIYIMYNIIYNTYIYI